MLAHEIGNDGYWTGRSVEVAEIDPVPSGFTRSAFPNLGDDEYALWTGRWVVSETAPPGPEPVDVPAYRRQALDTAMAYGNAITQGEMSVWAGVEPLSWTQQRDEARIVREGGALGDDAVLPGLAEDKGVTLEAYADDVWANAMRYQAVLRAAVSLRRSATNTLTDSALDTPEKVDAAVEQLRVEADALADQLGLSG